jgi:hypothetical protein
MLLIVSLSPALKLKDQVQLILSSYNPGQMSQQFNDANPGGMTAVLKNNDTVSRIFNNRHTAQAMVRNDFYCMQNDTEETLNNIAKPVHIQGMENKMLVNNCSSGVLDWPSVLLAQYVHGSSWQHQLIALWQHKLRTNKIHEQNGIKAAKNTVARS